MEILSCGMVGTTPIDKNGYLYDIRFNGVYGHDTGSTDV